jgi:prepilin-type N-terminal cleavage/methylation domain-containing protein/prepilin-type processing-associated H-X9-DG protein
MSTASGNQRVGGFSLIELMVVVGIIGVLASLLLSALSNAREKGLQTQCANNLRQLGIAQEQFVSEHHGYPFVGENSNPPNGFPKEGWADALGPYAGGYRLNTDRKPWQPTGVFHCPAATPPACPTFPEGIGYSDYGYNAFGVSRLFDTNGSLGLSPWMGQVSNQPVHLPVSAFEANQPVRESQIASPADMMAIGDGFVGNSRIIADATASLWRSSGAEDLAGSTRRANARHRGKAEVVFCDGHVEGPRLQSLFGDNSGSALRRWNRDNQPHRERVSPGNQN